MWVLPGIFVISASTAIGAYQKLNIKRAKYNIQKYFDYKYSDLNAKCRICDEYVEKTPKKIGSLTEHLRVLHEEFLKMYESAKRKNDLDLQQKKRPRCDDVEVASENDEEIENEEANASRSQPTMMANAEEVT
jgi:hypothetical protein